MKPTADVMQSQDVAIAMMEEIWLLAVGRSEIQGRESCGRDGKKLKKTFQRHFYREMNILFK